MRRAWLPLLAFLAAALTQIPAAGDEKPVARQPVLRQPIKRPPVRPGVPIDTTPVARLTDEEALKKANLSPDEAQGIIDYLKARTLTDFDQSQIAEVIAKFSSDDFETRVKATEEIEKFGAAALGPLKSAERDTDPEVAYRATQALRHMEKVPHSQVAAAAVRALVKLKHKDAAAVLIAFLPMADTEEVTEEIRAALVSVAVVDGKPEPALVKALDDKNVARRSAAYVALTEGGDAKQRIRIKEAYPLVKAAVRKETDTDARFLGLWALLMTTREKEFVPDLLEMIPKLPRGRIWQLEEFLLQAAGDAKPSDARFGKGDEALKKAAEAWTGWWKKSGEKLDLVKFDFKPRITGYTDIIEYDYRGYGLYRVTTLGPDLKEKAKIGGTGTNTIQYPSDVKKLSNGNYLVAEQNGNRVTERDSAGKIVKTTHVTQPLAIDLIPGGGMTVVCRNQVVSYDKDGKQQWTFNRQQYDIMTGRRMPNGDVVFFTNQAGVANCFRLAGKDGKEVGKGQSIGRVQSYQSIDATGDDKILICEYNRVAEYDLKTGKELWKYACNNATSCQRLPNGNTLVTLINQSPNGKVYEIDTAGEVVWEFESTDGLRPARAFRR